MAKGYAKVRKLYSASPIIEKVNIIAPAIYTHTLSWFGFLYDFLIVGRHQSRSIIIMSIIVR